MVGEAAELAIILTLKDEASAALKSFGAAADDLKANITAMGTLFAAVGATITGFGTASVKGFADMGRELADMSTKTGMSVQSISELKYMLDLSGGSLSNLQMGFKTMSTVLTGAAQGLKVNEEELALLGVSLQDLQGLSPDQIFFKMATAVADVPNKITQVDLATKIFGRTGIELLPVLAQGAAGIDRMRQAANDFGVTFNEQTIQPAIQAHDSIVNLQESFKGLTNAVAEGLMPIIIPLTEKLINIAKAVTAWAQQNPELVKTLFQVGVALVAAGAAMAAIIPIMAVIAALSGPQGWIALGVAVTAGGLAYFGTKVMIDKLNEATGQNIDVTALATTTTNTLTDANGTLADSYSAVGASSTSTFKTAIDNLVAVGDKMRDALHKAQVEYLNYLNMIEFNARATALNIAQIFDRLQMDIMSKLDMAINNKWSSSAVNDLLNQYYGTNNQLPSGAASNQWWGGAIQGPGPEPGSAEASAGNYGGGNFMGYVAGEGPVWSDAPQYAMGGIVPGMTGAPVPVIAHGGEAFGSSASGVSVIVNVNVGGTVASENNLKVVIRDLFLDIIRRKGLTPGLTGVF